MHQELKQRQNTDISQAQHWTDYKTSGVACSDQMELLLTRGFSQYNFTNSENTSILVNGMQYISYGAIHYKSRLICCQKRSKAHGLTTETRVYISTRFSRGILHVILQPWRGIRLAPTSAARMIYSSRRSEHITPLLRELHWLKRSPQRIQFRLCVLAYRCLHGTAPAYLSDSLRGIADIDARRRLRSADTSTLLSRRHDALPLVIERFQLLRHAPGTPFPWLFDVFVARQRCLRSAGSLRLILIAVLLTNSSAGSAYRALFLSFSDIFCTVLPQRFFNVWRHLNHTHIYITLHLLTPENWRGYAAVWSSYPCFVCVRVCDVTLRNRQT